MPLEDSEGTPLEEKMMEEQTPLMKLHKLVNGSNTTTRKKLTARNNYKLERIERKFSNCIA
jgi:hypothetical protein